MIYVLSPHDSEYASELVYAAIQRSVPPNFVEKVCASRLHGAVDLGDFENIWIIINPLPAWSLSLQKLLELASSKIILLGHIPENLWSFLDLLKVGDMDGLADALVVPPAPPHGESCSEARIEYRQGIAGYDSPIPVRHFIRYDFLQEWNNLGYGAITLDASPWALTDCLKAPKNVTVAEVVTGSKDFSTYAALWDIKGSLLWFARAVGPIDSQEWRLVEVYLAHYRHDALPCAPVISEIPAGYDAAVTMRLDCDEDVESARQLWNVYLQLDVPFSLALHASVLADSKQHQLPIDVLSSGGSIVSHTMTHAPNWGGSYQSAFAEGCESLEVIRSAIGYDVRYAVSPFHHTPPYARKALADAGFEGCVGGIISNDPDFLTARTGYSIGQGSGFIGFSQQCMLHGDCLQEENPLKIYKDAFLSAKIGQHFFGYLDHPFSKRYAYGWNSEEQRIIAHQDFISYIRDIGGEVLFASLEDAFDFLRSKNTAFLSVSKNGIQIITEVQPPNGWQIEYEYMGNRYLASHRLADDRDII